MKKVVCSLMVMLSLLGLLCACSDDTQTGDNGAEVEFFNLAEYIQSDEYPLRWMNLPDDFIEGEVSTGLLAAVGIVELDAQGTIALRDIVSNDIELHSDAEYAVTVRFGHLDDARVENLVVQIGYPGAIVKDNTDELKLVVSCRNNGETEFAELSVPLSCSEDVQLSGAVADADYLRIDEQITKLDSLNVISIFSRNDQRFVLRSDVDGFSSGDGYVFFRIDTKTLN